MLQSDIESFFEKYQLSDTNSDNIKELIIKAQELINYPPFIYVAFRVDIGVWMYVAFDMDCLQFLVVEQSQFLSFKEQLVGLRMDDGWRLKIDIGTFNRELPKIQDKGEIGRGIEFLNRYLSQEYFSKTESLTYLLEFLSLHQNGGTQLIINKRIDSVSKLKTNTSLAIKMVEGCDKDTSFTDIEIELQDLGFENGIGKGRGEILHFLNLLQKTLNNPSALELESLLDLIPMIFRVVIVSPHGFFGQSKVLGFPDTGGQVVYILDQVRALEKAMIESIESRGLDIAPEIIVLTRLIPNAQGTTCNERIEPIWGTKNAKILRVPFRNSKNEIMENWISRFQIWPYLEKFAIDSIRELKAELSGKPDLIIGNYSDGNLVATLLANSFKVTQCNIAHALEKTKYLFSALYWRDNEEEYRFSSQFSADLIGMNSCDFIISSTYQEIAGNEKSIGQYESYKTFTMPRLYQVIDGIDVYDPKFNIISPGANEDVFFPFTDNDRRFMLLIDEIKRLVYGTTDETSRGELIDKDKPIIFSIARLDRVKNLTSLVEWYGESEELQKRANLLIIAGHIDVNRSSDEEERGQIALMHELFNRYKLDNKARWLGIQLEKQLTGELYRYIADKKGVFVQPALFEAFGLTVVESISCGVPTFATKYGGPSEILEDGVSGFHIDPTNREVSIKIILDFFKKCEEDSNFWDGISREGIKRAEERYNWNRYAKRLLTLSKVYGFWKHITSKDREEIKRYIDLFYGLMFRPLVDGYRRD